MEGHDILHPPSSPTVIYASMRQSLSFPGGGGQDTHTNGVFEGTHTGALSQRCKDVEQAEARRRVRRE